MPERNTSAYPDIEDALQRWLARDPYLKPYAPILRRRMAKIQHVAQRLCPESQPLNDFASGHEYYGLHWRNPQWVLREWAPNATAIYLLGQASGWHEDQAFGLRRINRQGDWEIRLPADALAHGDLYRLRIHWPGGQGDRIPAYARRVVQDPASLIFNAQVWQPSTPYRWRQTGVKGSAEPLLIYEAHIGMAQEAEGVGTFNAFTTNVLPRVVASGYNTLQLMAIQEHPYYASFGYQVSSFFAPSHRFGTPDEFKALIDAAHEAGLRVIIDLIHSHAVANEVEGLSRFDGTLYQYFHAGPRGHHSGWDSRCFDYAKPQVLHFLLSNCRYWLDEFHLDGFRFDGITSMLYTHHGLGKAFTSYEDYFNQTVDEDALAYLALANRVIHGLRPDAVTIAEDVSGMPGLALDAAQGGIGFDYRFAMGVPDYWIRLIKDTRDEDWPMGTLWYELTNRRQDEHTISYAESHDQALVGDQTLMFRLVGDAMYDHMQVADDHLRVSRGMALHKMIRLITLATADRGYLNFMGNEFGHPEWIDFPREGNLWSYRYARRQWHLADDTTLKYSQLAAFDRDMVALVRHHQLLAVPGIDLLHEHDEDKMIIFKRGALLLAFNFHPHASFTDYPFAAPDGNYHMVLDTDAARYGGHARLTPSQQHRALPIDPAAPHQYGLRLYLPSRSALVLKRQP